MNDDALKY